MTISKGFTGTVSYCKLSGIKIAIGTEFHQLQRSMMLASSLHPVFSLSVKELQKLAKAAAAKGSPTEQYLALLAVGRSCGLWVLDSPPLELAQSAKLEAGLPELLGLLIEVSDSEANLPQLRLTEASGYVGVKDFLLECKAIADSWTRLKDRSSRAVSVLDSLAPLDWELELARELAEANKSGRAYTRKIGKWCLQWLQSEGLARESLELVAWTLHQETDRLHREQLRDSLDLLCNNMPLTDELLADKAMACIGYIESKLTVVDKRIANFGFALLEDELGALSGAGLPQYTRTAATVQHVPLSAQDLANVVQVSESGKPLTELEKALLALKAKRTDAPATARKLDLSKFQKR